MYLRVAIACSQTSYLSTTDVFWSLCTRRISLATPILCNAGLKVTGKQSLASCFAIKLESVAPDDIGALTTKVTNVILNGGGIGVNISCIASIVALKPLMENLDSLAVLGSVVTSDNHMRRPGLAIYLDMWHFGLYEFLHTLPDSSKTHLALMVPSLFMERLKQENSTWTLINPERCPGILEATGEEFERWYEAAELAGYADSKTIRIDIVWDIISKTILSKGKCYILQKDHINTFHDRRLLGKILHSNLCTEIAQENSRFKYVDPICILGAINVCADIDSLDSTVRLLTRILNSVHDINVLPKKYVAPSSRAIGIGIVGFADLCQKNKIKFVDGGDLLREIYRTIYYSSLCESTKLNEILGRCDDPSDRGILETSGITMQEMYPGFEFDEDEQAYQRYHHHELFGLKSRILKYGVRNKYLTAQMPTAYSSVIAGVNDGCEPYISNMFSKKLCGVVVVIVNPALRERLSRDFTPEKVGQILVNTGGQYTEMKRMFDSGLFPPYDKSPDWLDLFKTVMMKSSRK